MKVQFPIVCTYSVPVISKLTIERNIVACTCVSMHFPDIKSIQFSNIFSGNISDTELYMVYWDY